MRTNIDIDDATLEAAMKAGPYRTKKEAVEAGLKMLARRAAYREILKWEGKLHWTGDDEDDDPPTVVRTGEPTSARPVVVNSPRAKSPVPSKKVTGKSSHGRR